MDVTERDHTPEYNPLQGQGYSHHPPHCCSCCHLPCRHCPLHLQAESEVMCSTGRETPCPSLWALESESRNHHTDQMLLWTVVEVMDLDSSGYGDYHIVGR